MVLEYVAYAAGGGDQVQLDRALHRYFREGGSAVGVLRVVAGHIGRLQRVVGMVADGTSIEAAVGGLRPAIFFKLRDEFQRQASSWDLNRLQMAQKSFWNRN